MSENPPYEMPYPSSRLLTSDLGRIGREKHHIKALLEVDVTEARRKIKETRQTGRKISLMSWLIKVIGDCVAQHPPVSGINRPKDRRVVVFPEVDISIMVEKEVKGVRVPLPYVIRKADQKTFEQIGAEIETAKSQASEGESDYVLGKRSNPWGMKAFLRLPQWLRLLLMKNFVLNRPQRIQSMMGTVMITTVGMIGHTRGWIVPFSMHPLCLAIGSINLQPAVHQGEIQKREILHLTVLIDHDAIDGMPAASFVDDLVKKMEAAYGL